MINRRSLRIKAFKNLYAYESCKGANILMGLDLIGQKFSPDLNSMEAVDKEDLKRKKRLAEEAFNARFDAEKHKPEQDEEVEKEVEDALAFVERQNNADMKRLAKDVLDEAAHVTHDHISILALIEELAFQNKKLSDERKSLTNILGQKAQSSINFYQNQAIANLKADETYQELKRKHKINWANHADQIRDWYKGVLNKDETFREYVKKESPNYEEDWAIVDYICRGVILKNDVFTSFFEDMDLDWSENKPIVRSLVLKTVKSLKESTDTLQIADISYNWEDDSEYVMELFKITTRENEYLESLLVGKLENWDIERVALTDKVILKMALAELIHFPSIPTKVTINEFIEISKVFSTPKSKKFVNGILDKLTTELLEQGVIRKSGRGLLDNK
ncbi:MAG: transcription antitermination factor NusB [Cyclobacteriaceae bacterium]|nr:transcription antitermination factor NusB [Cyclobacteriaceae bacterium]